MSFGRLEGKRAPEPMSQINVTPLVDVMLVLLVIFMVTAPFFSGSLKLDLPRAPVASAPPRAAPSLLLELGRDGQLLLNGLAVTEAQLEQRLREVAALRPDAELQLLADRQAPYGRVLQLLAAANQAGVARVGFVAESTGPGRRP